MEYRSFPNYIQRAEDGKDGRLKIEGFANVATVDRHGTRFDPDGFELDAFRANPVGFYNHDPDLPAVRWEPSTIEVRQAKSAPGLWMQGEVLGDTERQREIQHYVRQGSVRTLSIGFVPIEVDTEETEDGRQVEVFTRSEILETSVVTVPSNRESTFELSRMLRRDRGVLDRLADLDARLAAMAEALANMSHTGGERISPAYQFDARALSAADIKRLARRVAELTATHHS